MESIDGVQSNIEKIAELFPNCITEALDTEKSTPDHPVYKKAINFKNLQQMLSGDIADENEAYEMTWVGKKAAIVEANKPIRKTLRPCPEESVNWDTTENLYIEGDNLEVLKLLQESYLGKVKMIYIDPPYNTGHDFVYPDSFIANSEDYNIDSKYFDEDGNINYKRVNSDTEGRFHSDWCSMIYSRLLLAKNLLTEDGFIFISIDDHEINTLRSICNEIFGEDNFLAQIIWQKRTSPDARKKMSTGHEYILAFMKNASLSEQALNYSEITEDDAQKYKNPDNDPRGPWVSTDFGAQGYRPNQMYKITTPGGAEYYPSEGRCWKNTEEGFHELLEDGRMWFGSDGKGVPRKKLYLSERDGKSSWTWWPNSEVGHTQEATQQLTKLLGKKTIFDYPKPVRLLRRLVKLATNDGDLIMDFFSGSATMAQAVMEINSDEQTKRKYILIQIPEKCDEKSDAYKEGYKYITDIGKERIKRASGELLKRAPLTTQNLDIGFRDFKLDSSNFKDVYYHPDKYSQSLLDLLESNIKEDRSDVDLFFGCVLDYGLPLSYDYIEEKFEGRKIHNYNEGQLIGCFEKDISENLVKYIANKKPLRVVFNDSSFSGSADKINISEIFKSISPETQIRVI